MAVPSSPPIDLTDVTLEVLGTSSGDLDDCRIAVGWSAPVDLTDFLGFAWGRVYGQEDISFDVWSYSTAQGYDAFGGGETLLYTANENGDVSLYKSATGTAITAGDAIRIELYYRTKNTSDSWVLSNGWNNYATASYSPHSLSSSLYDYKFIVTSNI